MVHYGVTGFGLHLGEPTEMTEVNLPDPEERERVLAYGHRTVLRAKDGIGLTDLAVGAGQAALSAAGTAAADLDLVVLATTDLTEHLFWDASASVTARLGATRAEACLLTQGCTTGVLAFDVVAGRLATHDDWSTALIIAGNRTVEQYWDRFTTQAMVFSDGAVAAVVRRDHPRLRWLVTEVLTDGRWAGFYRMPAGGGALPFGPAVTDPGDLRAGNAWDVMEFFDFDEDRFGDFVRQLDANAGVVLDRACRRAGVPRTALARVCVSGDNLAAMRSLIGFLDVDPDRSNTAVVAEHGHLGAADALLAVADLHARRALDPGDVVALLSRGRGMHWACTLLRA